MPKIDPTSYERAYARAVAYACSRARRHGWAHSDAAQDLAQEAMLASFDPDRYPWKNDKPLEHHVVNVVRSILSDRRRAAKLRADPARKAAADEAMKRQALPADASVRDAERDDRHERRHAWMLATLEGLTRDVYELYVKDVFDASAQAEALGKPIAAIYEARRRVAEAARQAPTEPDSSPELASGPDADPPSSDSAGAA